MAENGIFRRYLWVIIVPIFAILLNFAIFPEYTGDDSYIHFTYARNIIEKGVFAYNGTSPSYGSTSILWVILGAVVSWPSQAVPTAMRILGAGLFAASIVLGVVAVDKRHPLSLPGRFAVALFLTANAVIFRWMLTGMETGLVCFVTALLLQADDKHIVRAAVLSLAAFLVRPEFLFFPFCFLVALATGRQRNKRAMGAFGILTALLFGAWFAFAHWYFGRIMPMTAIKSVGWIDVPSTVRIIKVAAGAFPAIFVMALVLLVSRRERGEDDASFAAVERAFLLFGGVLVLFYLLRGTNLISRYLTVVYLPLGVICARGISLRWMKGGRIQWQAGVLIVLALCVEAGAFAALHAPHIRRFVAGFQRTYTAMGERIVRRGEGDSGAVMVADVGLIGYYSRRPVIDLSGLTSSHIYDAGTRADSVLLARYHPRFVIVREEDSNTPAWHAMLERVATGSVQKISSACIPPLGVMSDPAHWWQVELFEVTYGAEESAPSSVVRGGAADPTRRRDR